MTNEGPLWAAMARYLDGDDDAGDAICVLLRADVVAAAARALRPDDADLEDVVQESLLAFLRYLRRAGSAPDNPEAFVVTVARNRCLNLHAWRKRRVAVDIDKVADVIPDDAISIFDLLARRQRENLVRAALADLDLECRRLLDALYREGRPVGDLMVQLGLGSVQAVYFRRNACLRSAQKFLNRRLFAGRQDGPDGPAGRTPDRPVEDRDADQ